MKKIFLHVLFLVGISLPLQAQSTGEILTFPKNPQKGFEWGYALYLPQEMDTSKPLPILLTMNNEDVEDSLEELEQEVLRALRKNYSLYGIADGVHVPLLVPLVLQGKGLLHTHQINRATFVTQEGPFARLDEQILAMLQDARTQLATRNIKTDKKFLVAGFSSAGAFAWRWMMLHPTQVLAGAVGGHQDVLYPLEKYKDIPLIYPAGVYDFKMYTGRKFDKQAWKKIPILLVNGGADYNDPLPYKKVYGEEESRTWEQLYGDKNLQQKWQQMQTILAPLAPNVQMHTYPHLGHETIWQDEIDFLNKHLNGGPLKPIIPTDTSSYPALLPIRVNHLYFGKKAPIQKDREYLEDTDLILQTEQEAPYWIRYKNACRLDILSDGEPVLHKIFCRGIFATDEGYSFLQVFLSTQEIEQLKQTGKKEFSVYSHFPDILFIPENLTFKID